MSELQDISLNAQKVEVTIGGKKRTLLYDMFAFAELEKEFGDLMSVQEALQVVSIKNVLIMLRAGLLHENENLTIKELGHSMGLRDLQQIVNNIVDAIMGSLPQAGEASETVGESQEPPMVS